VEKISCMKKKEKKNSIEKKKEHISKLFSVFRSLSLLSQVVVLQ
jgi:hypothetical protein